MTNEITGGCILIARSILTSEIWLKPPEYLKIFMYILLKVNYRDNPLFERGTNLFNFSQEVGNLHGIAITQIYNFLRWAKSEKVGILTTQKTTRGIVIKVNNYNKFQTLENYYLQDTLQDSCKTVTKQLQDSCNTIIKERIKENKEINNKDNIIGKNKKSFLRFTPPTIEEIQTYCIERNNNIDPEYFYDYYESNDWHVGKSKMKDWKAAVRTWERNQNFNKTENPKKESEIDGWTL